MLLLTLSFRGNITDSKNEKFLVWGKKKELRDPAQSNTSRIRQCLRYLWHEHLRGS
jgi:hypothetical protein